MKRVYLYCKCGCGSMPNLGKMFISGHNRRGKKASLEVKEKMSQAAKKRAATPEGALQLKKLSDISRGKKQSPEFLAKLSLIRKGIKFSEAAKIKMSISQLHRRQAERGRPLEYCDSWYDKEYRNYCRKSACETCGLTNMLSMKVYSCQLSTHHKNGREACAPSDIETLCCACHTRLHHKGKIVRRRVA